VELYRQLIITADQDEQDALMHQILDIAVEEFYCMGIALRQEEYGIVNNRIRNTPAVSTTGWLHAELMPNNPQQFYIDEEPV
jgi:peptide/nickel transport system substrate-binding protein